VIIIRIMTVVSILQNTDTSLLYKKMQQLSEYKFLPKLPAHNEVSSYLPVVWHSG